MQTYSILENLGLSKSFEELESLSGRALAASGFSSYFMSEVGRNAKSRTFGQPCNPQFLEYYSASNMQSIDPIAKKLQFNWLPIAWDARDIYNESTGLCADLFRQSLEIGHERGISVALRGPRGREFRLVAIFDGSRAKLQECQLELGHEVHLIAAHIANAYERMSADSRQTMADLTPREWECLEWSCQGKTAWETATILGISERTVHFHLQNTIRKMGCGSKYECCQKAIELGLTNVH